MRLNIKVSTHGRRNLKFHTIFEAARCIVGRENNHWIHCTTSIWTDGFEVGSGFTISLESGGAGTGANLSFGGINLYSASGDPTADCEYYVDDIMLVETTASGAGINETELVPSMVVLPNPSKGNFVLNYDDMSMENATVTLVDVLGKTIYSKKMNIVGNASLAFDLNLRNGVYFVSVSNAHSKLTKKIIVKK